MRVPHRAWRSICSQCLLHPAAFDYTKNRASKTRSLFVLVIPEWLLYRVPRMAGGLASVPEAASLAYPYPNAFRFHWDWALKGWTRATHRRHASLVSGQERRTLWSKTWKLRRESVVLCFVYPAKQGLSRSRLILPLLMGNPLLAWLILSKMSVYWFYLMSCQTWKHNIAFLLTPNSFSS